MNGAFRRLTIPAVSLTISACAGLTQMQDSLNKFGSGATSVSSTEMTFFNKVQALDCSVQFYSSAADWALGAAQSYDISGLCKPQLLSNDQLAIRQHILDGITVYAGKIQALASTAGDKTLDTNGQKLASQLNNLATKPGGITKADGTIAAGVEAALIQLANMALDQTRYKDAKRAATDMAPYLETVVDELKTENSDFGSGIDSKRGKLELALRKVVDTVPTNTQALRFSALIDARQVVRSTNPFGQEALNSATGIPTPDTNKLNAALDGIVSANKAIATAGEGGIAASVTDLVTRAQAAQADEVAITK
jgi:hypothetical protein